MNLKELQTPKQLSLEETEGRIRAWKVNDPRAQQITCYFGSLDSQLFVVEDSGFISLLKEIEPHYTIISRKYITETILPRIVKSVTDEVRKEFQRVK